MTVVRSRSLRWALFRLGLALCGLAPPALAQEDGAPTRSASNPLMTHGASGSIDQLKIGPRAMLREGPSDWKMWYEAAFGGNKGYAAYATSSDGLAWTKYSGNPVMSPSAAWEGGSNNSTGETSPTSVLKEQGVYKLWYHGFSNNTRRIGYATSPDGISWTKYSGNPVLTPGASGAWDADSVCEPNVVHVGSTYYMYYSRCTGAGGIGLATSSDGVTWTKYSGNPVIATGTGWENQQVDWAGVYHDGQRFHLWYLGRAAGDTGGFSLGYAYSTDGKTFTKTAANPVLAPPNPFIVSTDYALNKGDGIGIENSAKVLRLGNTWRFYYGGFASCCPEDATLCMATSQVLTSPNRAPIVDAGRALVIDVGANAALDGTVMDDDTPVVLSQVTSTWTQVSGPGTATFRDAGAVDTSVSFDTPGNYVLRLTANDTALSGLATVTIQVNPASGGGDAGSGGSGGSGGSNDGGSNTSGGSSNGGSNTSGGSSNGDSNASGGVGNGGTAGNEAGTSGAAGASSGTGGTVNPGGSSAGSGGARAESSPKSTGGCTCRIERGPDSNPELLWLVIAAGSMLRRRRRFSVSSITTVSSTSHRTS
jgi:MYXO-CTERM domain-containing protein